jgi:hypothetical protein
MHGALFLAQFINVTRKLVSLGEIGSSVARFGTTELPGTVSAWVCREIVSDALKITSSTENDANAGDVS